MIRYRPIPISILLLSVLTACDSSGPVASTPESPATAPSGAIALRCTATVSSGSVTCEAERPGVRGDLLLGGQGVRVKLASSNVSYDGVGTMQADVTVQNLLSQPLGTPDGVTVAGVSVFFSSQPVTTSGTGAVTVQNPDGLGTFTSSNQPYFLYNQILQPRGTSAPHTWKFNVPPTVGSFAFSVYVSAQAAAETGVLRWLAERGALGTEHLQGVWGVSDSSVFAVGQGGIVQHWNGHQWTELATGTTDGLNGIHGTGNTDVHAAGSFGTLLHYDGNTWTKYSTGGGIYWSDVWAAAPGNAFAVGTSGAIRHWDGSAWTAMSAPAGTGNLWTAWGTSATNVFAGGDNGVILHWDGFGWTQMASNTTKAIRGIWGTSATDVWAVGGAGTIRHYNGVTWDSIGSPAGTFLTSVWGSSSTDVYAVGNFGTLIHWDGTSWSNVVSPTGNNLVGVWGTPGGSYFTVGDQGMILTRVPAGSWQKQPGVYGEYLYAVAAQSAAEAYAVGYGGLILHWNGASWSTVNPAGIFAAWYGTWYDGAGSWYVAGDYGYILRSSNGVFGQVTSGTPQGLRGIWGSAPNDVFAVGAAGTIVHSTGGAFAAMTSATAQQLYAVWGSSGSDVFAVGYNGTIVHYDGAAWSTMTSGTTAPLYSVWGTGPANVWAVGFNGTVLHYDGSVWSTVPTGTTATLQAVWASADGAVYVAGINGLLMQYTGGTWAHYGGTSNTLYGLYGLSGKDVYAVGAAQLILHGKR